MNTYQIDTVAQLSVTFTTIDGSTPIDPLDVSLMVQDPNGGQTTYGLNDFGHPSAGIFTYDLNLNAHGPWIYNWQGSGNVVTATGDQYILVAQTVFG